MNILERLQKDYDLCSSKYELVGVFLFGSQNYGCSTEHSDIDTKAIVIPSIEQMITGNIKISNTLQAVDGEITVFDIKHICDSIKKQNVNFLEILFTEYYIINPKYEQQFQYMREHAEEIARMNEYAAVQCINGIFINKYNKIFKLLPSNNKRIEKYGYDCKALADCIRLYQMVLHYIQGICYQDCLRMDSTIVDYIVSVKQAQPQMTVDEAVNISEELKYCMDETIKTYVNTHDPICNEEVSSRIDSVVIDCCTSYIKEHLGG